MVAWVAAFDAQIQARTGRMPIIYTPPSLVELLHRRQHRVRPGPAVGAVDHDREPGPARWLAELDGLAVLGTGTVSGISDPGHTDLDQANPAFLGLLNPGTQDQSNGAPAGPPAAACHPGARPDRELHRDRPAARRIHDGGGEPPGWLTRAGTYPVHVSGSDAAGATGSLSFSWTVSAASGQGPARCASVWAASA